jgi:uncharacterized protein (TIGR00369 family)
MSEVFEKINRDEFGATMIWMGLRYTGHDGDEACFSLVFPNEASNPMGMVQGGMMSAALDDITSATIIDGYNGEKAPLTTDLHVMIHRPLTAGPAKARARIIKLGRQVATCEGRLFDASNKLVATMLHSAQPVTPPSRDS